jgi:hypothetical protein
LPHLGGKLGVTRSHKTKQLLADLREEESKEEEVVTKSMPIPRSRRRSDRINAGNSIQRSPMDFHFSSYKRVTARHRVLWDTQFLDLKI